MLGESPVRTSCEPFSLVSPALPWSPSDMPGSGEEGVPGSGTGGTPGSGSAGTKVFLTTNPSFALPETSVVYCGAATSSTE